MLNKLFEEYKDRVAFYVVYIQEAHPIDAWQQEENVKEKIAISSPRSFQERCAVADACITKLSIHIPALIDDLENSTEAAYTSWPDRLYLIDRDGRIAYKSRPGPFGFKPGEISEALKRLRPSAPVEMTWVR